MDYLWLKCLHIAAVLAWAGGLLAALLALAAAAGGQGGQLSSGRLRRLAHAQEASLPGTLPYAPAAALGLVCAVVVLVVLKPF
ncbi:hypothetical protein V8Z80_02985 [Orrella sp. JC864]|uniref:hypothetical protein n=1 Tax=Orrella sp. JC864 TaxID=3120298 RepID=UPI0012BC2F93